MPYKLSWYIPKRVLYSEANGNQLLAEMLQVNTTLTSLLDAGVSPVHFILCDERIASVPRSLSLPRNTMSAFHHPNLGWTLAVGRPRPVVNYRARMAGQIFQMKQERVADTAAALAFLKAHDASLDWATARPAVIQPDYPGDLAYTAHA